MTHDVLNFSGFWPKFESYSPRQPRPKRINASRVRTTAGSQRCLLRRKSEFWCVTHVWWTSLVGPAWCNLRVKTPNKGIQIQKTCFLWTLDYVDFFSRERLRRVLRKKAAVILDLHTFTPADLDLHTLTPADLDLHTFTSADLDLHTLTPADLDLHSFTSADLDLQPLRTKWTLDVKNWGKIAILLCVKASVCKGLCV